MGFSASIEVGTDGWATVWVPGLLGLFLNEPSERRSLGPFPDLGRTTDPVKRLARVRRMAFARLKRLTPTERARIRKIDHEWWSTRKMLGRFLYHERYHLRSMARIVRYHGVRVPVGVGGWAAY